MSSIPFATRSPILGLAGFALIALLWSAQPRSRAEDSPVLQGIDADARGEYDRAIDCFNMAIRLNAKDAPAYYNRGLAYAHKGEREKAMADFDKTIELDPKFEQAYGNRGFAFQALGKLDRAIADFNEVIQLDQKDCVAYYNRGIAYGQKGDFDKAIADFDDAVRINPVFVEAYGNRGFAYELKGDLEQAQAKPDEAGADYTKAIANYEVAIRLDPRSAINFQNFAWLLGTCPQAAFRDGKKAVRYAMKVGELSEWKSVATLETLAAAEAEAGDFDAAVRSETKAAEALAANEEARAEAKRRLALYQAHQSFHAETKAAPPGAR
jgi:tetratricopeptide (TPR) repeat protein